MRLDVYFTTTEADAAVVQEATVVVIDVVRATTSMVEALAQGARAVFPTSSTEDAVKLAASLGREDTLLCGERKGVKIEGFDLGNSPLEFTADVVDDKRLVWTTTNGTAALAAVREAPQVLVGAFTNLSAVAAVLRGEERVVLQCAGRANRFAMEDALCAGHLLRLLVGGGPDAQFVEKILGPDVTAPAPDLNDAARASLALAQAVEPTEAFLATTAAGQNLADIGQAGDLALCARVDRHAVVPHLADQALTLLEG